MQVESQHKGCKWRVNIGSAGQPVLLGLVAIDGFDGLRDC